MTVSGYEVPAPGVHLIDSHPSALIFAPPNSVAPDHRRPLTQPDPIHYVAPLKAAGDVSLNGAQLVSFLIKATLKLTPVSLILKFYLKWIMEYSGSNM